MKKSVPEKFGKHLLSLLQVGTSIWGLNTPCSVGNIYKIWVWQKEEFWSFLSLCVERLVSNCCVTLSCFTTVGSSFVSVWNYSLVYLDPLTNRSKYAICNSFVNLSCFTFYRLFSVNPTAKYKFRLITHCITF